MKIQQMKGKFLIIICIVVSNLIFISNADNNINAASVWPETTRVYPTNDSTFTLELKPVGKDLQVTAHNVILPSWQKSYDKLPIWSEATYSKNYGSVNIKFYITGTPPILGNTDKDADDGMPDKGELYKTPPFFDMTFTIENVENGVYNLEYIIDGSVMDASNTEIRNIHEVTSIALNSETLNIKANNGISPDNIVREGVEWVLYQAEPDNNVKLYRMQFKGKADVFFPGDEETIKDAARLFLYTDATLDEERDPVIAYFKPAGALNARIIPADVDIPVGFWASWGTTPPCETINPYKMFRDAGDAYHLSSLVGEGFTVSQLPEDEKMEAKWYWNNYITGLKCPMFKQEYIDITTKAETPKYALTMSENMDGTGYQGRWESGIGPVGEDYVSNLPYPVYSIERGLVPTRLLYVRDINTNEVLWGDPKLDPAYNSVGELTNDNDGIAVYGGQGIITVESEGTVRIYTTAGTLLTTVSCPSTVSSAPGLYIAVSGSSSRKILVK